MKKMFVLLILSVLIISCKDVIKPLNTNFTAKLLPEGEVTLSIDSYVNNAIYKVDWGDGNTEDLSEVQKNHIYEKDGEYIIKVSNKARLGSKEGENTQKVTVNNCVGTIIVYTNSANSSERYVIVDGKDVGSLTKYLVNPSVIPDCSWSTTAGVIVVKGLKLNKTISMEFWRYGTGSAKIFDSVILKKNRECVPYLNNY